MYPKPKPKVKKKSYIKPISDKRKKRLLGYSEVDLFREFMIKNQDDEGFLTCEITGKKVHITQAKPWCFGHILSKKDYPAIRLFMNNICFVAGIEEHQLLDKYVAGNKREIEQKILNGATINILNNNK